MCNTKRAVIHPNKDEKPYFFTIGYEGKSLDHYLHCLIENNIKILRDVHKNSISRNMVFRRDN